MKIAVQNPFFLQYDLLKNYNGYDFTFIKKYKPLIYLTKEKYYNQFLINMRNNNLNPMEYEFITDNKKLNNIADVLLCFNGRPDLEWNSPPENFNGMKIFHVMDYVFKSKESNFALEKGNVDYVMGYANHGKYCAFFNKYYPKYKYKVISVPFGYGKRFEVNVDFFSRSKKAIALGSVNPIDDPLAEKDELKEYVEFYKNSTWTHKWRRILAENEEKLADIMVSLLPQFPETKNQQYDAVSMMNDYMMFPNDEGLMEFPPARTYEGVATGCVMLCSGHECYSDLGFKNGINCIFHEKYDVQDFREKVEYYINNVNILKNISESGSEFVRKNYSHEAVATKLYSEITRLYNK